MNVTPTTLCPKCGKLAHYDSYSECYVCEPCGYQFNFVPEYESYDALIASLTDERDHLQRTLDVAITELRANGDCPTNATCEHIWRLNADPPEEVCRKCWFDYLDQKANDALSSTPSSAHQVAEDARIGRAVAEWADIEPHKREIHQRGYWSCMSEIRQVIDKAREG